MEIRARMRGLLFRGLLLVGILIALTLFINLPWFDESLIPEIEALTESQPVSLDGNAFPLVFGFPAASDRDPREAGLAIVQALRERYRQGEAVTLSDEEMAGILGKPGPKDNWRDAFPGLSCASREETGCADVLIADFDESDRYDQRLAVLLDRYETILRQPRFEENQEFDVTTPIPDYGQLIAVSRVWLADSYGRESTARFLADVSEDLGFWKLMLRDGQSLIAKMVALAGIRNNLSFVSAVLRNRDLADQELESITRIITPLTEEERDIGETFIHELRIGLLSQKVLALVETSTPLLDRFVLQENATLNEAYGMWTLPLRLRASFSADEFWRQRGYERLHYSVRAFPPPLYNLGGKLGLKRQAAGLNAQDYIMRVHNLNGRISLALLHAEIVSSPDMSTEEVVRSSGHRNPFTLEPMDYDTAARTIGFDCLTERTNEICAVALGRRGL